MPGSRVSSEAMCQKITEFSLPIIAAVLLQRTTEERGKILDEMVNILAETLAKISLCHDKDFFIPEVHRSLALFFASRTEKVSEHQPEELAFLLAQFSGYVHQVSGIE